MNITGLGSSAVQQASKQANGDVVATAVLKKALDSEAAGAVALLNALPKPIPAASSSNPPHLGQNIDVVA